MKPITLRTFPIYLEADQVEALAGVVEAVLDDESPLAVEDLWRSMNQKQLELLDKVLRKLRFIVRVSKLRDKGGSK